MTSLLQYSLLVLHGLSLFSNSFILEEGRVLVFLSTTSFLLVLFVQHRDAGVVLEEREGNDEQKNIEKNTRNSTQKVWQ